MAHGIDPVLAQHQMKLERQVRLRDRLCQRVNLLNVNKTDGAASFSIERVLFEFRDTFWIKKEKHVNSNSTQVMDSLTIMYIVVLF